jgi:hypothetical protein
MLLPFPNKNDAKASRSSINNTTGEADKVSFDLEMELHISVIGDVRIQHSFP